MPDRGQRYRGLKRCYAPCPAACSGRLGLTAGVAIAGGLACAVAWGYTRASVYGAGLAFMLIEGLFRSLPDLLPPGALQAGSFAALLALTAPLLSGLPYASRRAAACREVRASIMWSSACREGSPCWAEVAAGGGGTSASAPVAGSDPAWLDAASGLAACAGPTRPSRSSWARSAGSLGARPAATTSGAAAADKAASASRRASSQAWPGRTHEGSALASARLYWASRPAASASAAKAWRRGPPAATARHCSRSAAKARSACGPMLTGQTRVNIRYTTALPSRMPMVRSRAMVKSKPGPGP
ncbi:hypothetical protein G6F31_015532 [Rhizopus arrhizus]|nr:hypothetical protein G6F31_015532 [Rhizopus arrhizus]